MVSVDLWTWYANTDKKLYNSDITKLTHNWWNSPMMLINALSVKSFFTGHFFCKFVQSFFYLVLLSLVFSWRNQFGQRVCQRSLLTYEPIGDLIVCGVFSIYPPLIVLSTCCLCDQTFIVF